jgi:hypothetical protein
MNESLLDQKLDSSFSFNVVLVNVCIGTIKNTKGNVKFCNKGSTKGISKTTF